MVEDTYSTESEPISVASIRRQLEQDEIDPIAVLRRILNSDGYPGFFANLQGAEALDFIELLDHLLQALGSVSTDADLFKELRKLCGRTGTLPSSHMLRGGLVKTSDIATASGGFGDVWKGAYKGRRVAIKSLRVCMTDDLDDIKRKFCKEVVMWKRLSHPNVVPFIGVSTNLFAFCMVSEWMSQGHIRRYVQSNPETNRVKLLIDIGEGLNYLHSSKIVHGDLKGANILVNEEGWACICDFGLTSIVHTLGVTTSISSARGSIRWMAPELFDTENAGPEITRPTEASDVFALGMVVIEVFTGLIPFPKIRHDAQVMLNVIQGLRPSRPEQGPELGLSDPLWNLVEMCWRGDRLLRPSASFILDSLRRADPAISLLPFIEDFDTNSKESIRLLRSALSSRDDLLLQLHSHDAHNLIDILDQAMDSPLADEELSKKCLRALRRICGRTGYLPSSYTIPEGRLTKTRDLAFASSGFADLWEGMYDNRKVRIKSLRINVVMGLGRIKTGFCSEAAVWKRFKHPNIVPFLGVSTTLEPLCSVSVWMPKGNINQYLNSYPDANRLRLLLDVTQGLKYLHSFEVVHGNLKGTDILIDEAGNACLTDYGLASILNETLSDTNSDTDTYLSTRWMAPELLNPDNPSVENNRVSKASDIYSFAMVVIEIFSGNVPFHEYRKEGVIVRVIEGIRPERPKNTLDIGLSDAVWQLVEMCWQQEQEDRPTISYVLQSLRKAASIDRPSRMPGFTIQTNSDSDSDALPLDEYDGSSSFNDMSKDEVHDTTKSVAQTRNNFGPSPVKSTGTSEALFRSFVRTFGLFSDSPNEDKGIWGPTDTSPGPSSMGVGNDNTASVSTIRPIKTRRGGVRRTRKVVAPATRVDLGISDGEDLNEGEWAFLDTLAVGEKLRGQGGWHGEAVGNLPAKDSEDIEQPREHDEDEEDENLDGSVGKYAQW